MKEDNAFAVSTKSGASDYLPEDIADLNDDEKGVFNSCPHDRLAVIIAAQYAFEGTSDLYSDGFSNGNADAFRHNLWNVIGSYGAGISYMSEFATAHKTGASTIIL